MEIIDQTTNHLFITSLIALAAIILAIGSRKLRIPVPAAFLLAGGIASYFFAVDRLDINALVELGTFALVLIIFEAGFAGGWSKFRPVLGPVVSLGLLGTFLMAIGLTLASYFLLGLPLVISLIIGIALSPTDPAAVFSVLSGQKLIGRGGRVLEGEAGANDPVSIALMIGVVEWAAHHGAGGVGFIAHELFAELCIGLVIGAVLGYIANHILTRYTLMRIDLLLLAMLAVAFMIYSLTALAGGSGFLAVFIGGLIIGEAPIKGHDTAHDLLSSLGGIAEYAMFALLGFAVTLTSLTEHWLAIIIIFVIMTAFRFAIVHGLLYRSLLSAREKHFIAWGGLKGAVPILLAALAVSGHAPGAEKAASIVFGAVILSILIQGGTLRYMAGKMNLLQTNAPDTPPDDDDLLVVT